jgi:hypothetical protein
VPFDVLASLEDVLDTWGPGELIFRPGHIEYPLAIKIGGGYICPPPLGSNGKYHWGCALNLSDASPSLGLKSEIVIGCLFEVNISCINDEETFYNDSLAQFYNLGVYRSYYEVIETQAGFQGGPDHFAVTRTVVWGKRPGRTVKASSLEIWLRTSGSIDILSILSMTSQK